MSEITHDDGVSVELSTLAVIAGSMMDWINRKQVGLPAPAEEFEMLKAWAKLQYTDGSNYMDTGNFIHSGNPRKRRPTHPNISSGERATLHGSGGPVYSSGRDSIGLGVDAVGKYPTRNQTRETQE